MLISQHVFKIYNISKFLDRSTFKFCSFLSVNVVDFCKCLLNFHDILSFVSLRFSQGAAGIAGNSGKLPQVDRLLARNSLERAFENLAQILPAGLPKKVRWAEPRPRPRSTAPTALLQARFEALEDVFVAEEVR